MKKFLLMSAAAMTVLTLPAFAADIIPPEPVANWTAFHIGVGGGAGYNFYDAESDFVAGAFNDGDPDFVMGIEGDDLGAWYGFGTVEIGFDYQFEDTAFVVGILANYDFNGSNDAEANAGHLENDGDFTESHLEAELDDSWFLGGRLGFVMNENTLLYGLGGYTWVDGKVKASHEFEDSDFPFDDGTEFDDKKAVDGWTIGAGLEHLITENVSLKIEYRHDFLDNIDWDEFADDPSEDDGGIDEDNTQSGKVDFSRDTVRAVLSWRFNVFGM